MTGPLLDASRTTGPFARYGSALAVVLLGYLLFDRAFAYLHPPGVPLFVGEALLLVGLVGVVRDTGTFRSSVAAEPVLALLSAFLVWGAVRTVPGLPEHGLDAVRDAALWYYVLFALLAVAAVAARPGLPLDLARGVRRLVPILLLWLTASVLLAPLATRAPTVPFSDVSVLSHKPGAVGLAALLVLMVLWLVPWDDPPQHREAWSMVALVLIGLVGTQNRGGMLGVLAGMAVALPFLHDRLRVVTRAAAVMALALALALLLSLKVPFPGLQGRDYSAAQLVTNVISLTGADTPGENLGGTVDGRAVLWSRLLHKQVVDGRLLAGSGFGPNLAAEVGVFDDGEDSLRNPHNTHLHVLARMGVLGAFLWVLFWLGWYARMAGACLRWGHERAHADRQLTGICLAFTTAVLVSTAFDPQLEGPQGAVLLWTLVGVGLAVSRRRS